MRQHMHIAEEEVFDIEARIYNPAGLDVKA
jgi:hypothetical protein